MATPVISAAHYAAAQCRRTDQSPGFHGLHGLDTSQIKIRIFCLQIKHLPPRHAGEARRPGQRGHKANTDRRVIVRFRRGQNFKG